MKQCVEMIIKYLLHSLKIKTLNINIYNHNQKKKQKMIHSVVETKISQINLYHIVCILISDIWLFLGF